MSFDIESNSGITGKSGRELRLLLDFMGHSWQCELAIHNIDGPTGANADYNFTTVYQCGVSPINLLDSS